MQQNEFPKSRALSRRSGRNSGGAPRRSASALRLGAADDLLLRHQSSPWSRLRLPLIHRRGSRLGAADDLLRCHRSSPWSHGAPPPRHPIPAGSSTRATIYWISAATASSTASKFRPGRNRTVKLCKTSSSGEVSESCSCVHIVCASFYRCCPGNKLTMNFFSSAEIKIPLL